MPNAELAYQVLDLALANEKHFDMFTWVSGSSKADLTALTAPTCGTTACLAGWAAAAAGYCPTDEIEAVVAEIFGPRPEAS